MYNCASEQTCHGPLCDRRRDPRRDRFHFGDARCHLLGCQETATLLVSQETEPTTIFCLDPSWWNHTSSHPFSMQVKLLITFVL